MLAPTDDGMVASRETELSFMGYDLEPDRVVRVLGYRPSTGKYQTVAWARGSTQATSYAGWGPDTKLYQWNAKRQIPEALWTEGARGYKAELRPEVFVNGEWQSMVSVEPDWGTCLAKTSSLNQFASQCASDRSPKVTVYTKDYCSRTRVNQSNGLRVDQHWIGKKVADASIEFVLTAPVAGAKVKSARINLPSNRLDFTPRCELFRYQDSVNLECGSFSDRGNEVGALMKYSCESLLSIPQKIEVTMEYEDDSVPTGCGKVQDSFYVTSADCHVWREEAPEPEPEPELPPPERSGYRAFEFSNCYRQELDLTLWTLDAQTGEQISTEHLPHQGSTCMPGQTSVELEEGRWYLFYATLDKPGCSGHPDLQNAECKPYSGRALGDADGIVEQVLVH